MASASSKKVIYAALGGNFLIALTKFIAFFVTQSSAMLSEGVHSVVDTSNQVLLLYGLRRAKKPADAQFPFGHGKEVYFWGFIVAIMIFTVEVPASLYTRAYITFCTPSPFKTRRSTTLYWHLLCFLKALPGILP